jgi:hypothetical protein
VRLVTLIAVLVLLAAPLAAEAQQVKTPKVGVLLPATPTASTEPVKKNETVGRRV